MVRAMIYPSLQDQLQKMVNVQKSKLDQLINQSLRPESQLPQNGMFPFHATLFPVSYRPLIPFATKYKDTTSCCRLTKSAIAPVRLEISKEAF